MTVTDSDSEPELRFASRMSDFEALMWNVEKDPWLNPSGATVSLLDRPVDTEQFARRLRFAVAKIPRLRERVMPGLGRLSPPVWATDPEFDFDYHLRHVSLPSPGSVRQLYDLVTRFYEDPFDRTRPLWQFVVIDGLEGGRGAVFWKVHHTISDGIGLIRLSEAYMEPRRHAKVPVEVDLDRVIADTLAHERHDDRRFDGPQSLVTAASRSAGHLWRRQLGIARRTAGEAALLTVDPLRAKDQAEAAIRTVRGTIEQARGGGGADIPGGSPLWRSRSRRRHLESLGVSLEAAKAAGQVLGGSINDFFVAGAVQGAIDYHDLRGAEVDALNISFVVSTRAAGDTAAGGNSFTPTRVQVPGGTMTPEARFRAVRDRMAERRSGTAGQGAFGGVAGLANLLPTSVVTRVARSQVMKVDFATSNMRAAPFPMYISGAEIIENVTMGPVAGTAFNLTAISYNGSLDMGVFMDPVAVTDPGGLRDCLAAGYAQLLDAAGMAPSANSRPRARSSIA
jgi:diacylglycerol O-acyltransferase / wax synthase